MNSSADYQGSVLEFTAIVLLFINFQRFFMNMKIFTMKIFILDGWRDGWIMDGHSFF